METNKQQLILLVEDDAVDAMTVQRALKDLRAKDKLVIRRNGAEALEYLRTATNEKPSFILLDLNMPRMNGIEFMKTAKQDAQLRRIPVVVLTTSKAQSDRLQSFDLSASGYMVKPLDYPQFVEMVRHIRSYWTKSELGM